MSVSECFFVSMMMAGGDSISRQRVVERPFLMSTTSRNTKFPRETPQKPWNEETIEILLDSWGTVYDDQGLYGKATVDYTRATELNPKHAEVRCSLALACKKANRSGKLGKHAENSWNTTRQGMGSVWSMPGSR